MAAMSRVKWHGVTLRLVRLQTGTCPNSVVDNPTCALKFTHGPLLPRYVWYPQKHYLGTQAPVHRQGRAKQWPDFLSDLLKPLPLRLVIATRADTTIAPDLYQHTI